MIYTITNIGRKDIETKYGTKVKVGVQLAELPNEWVGCFEKLGVTDKWEVGSKIDIEIEQNGKWKNIKLPRNDVSREEFNALVKRVEALEKKELIEKLDGPSDDLPF